MKRRLFLCIAIAVILLSGCGKGKIYQSRQTLKDNTWNRIENGKTLTFDNINIEDSVAVYDIYVTLRHTPYINDDKIKFVMRIISPSGIIKETSHTIKLKNRYQDKWIGDAMGDMIDVENKCRSFVTFPEKGKYTITLTNMGTQYRTVGLMDIGLKIEKSDLDYNVNK
ncbi:MAG: gliding motility lipoprotein GldH [Bacteroidales bacterium]|jgi:gliding motility-associated lipoprotein GldH|nr:gliding motility lipoprotein GldH [Bacteroidales bacterium]